MTDQHPITPSFGLVNEWVVKLERNNDAEVFAEAARWGADQELEACIKLLSDLGGDGEMIRRHRRPKPKSLAEEALEALKHAEEGWRPVPADCDIIRRALKRLQELEGQGDD